MSGAPIARPSRGRFRRRPRTRANGGGRWRTSPSGRQPEGQNRWDVRWTALGRWRTKTFKRRSDADAFRRTDRGRRAPRRGRRRPPLVGAVRRVRHRLASDAAPARRPPAHACTRALYGDLLSRLILPTFRPRQAGVDPAGAGASLARRNRRPGVTAAGGEGLPADADDPQHRGAGRACWPLNPCNIEGGGVERSAERPLIDTEAVFDLAEAIDPRYRALILLIAFGPGARKGEFRAYRRRHVDLLHARIRTEVQEQDSGGGLVASAAKNDSARWTTLPAFLVDELVPPPRHLRAGRPGRLPVHRPEGRRASPPSTGTRASASPETPSGSPSSTPTTSATLPGPSSPSRAPRPGRSWPGLGHRSRAAADRYQHAAARRDAELAERLNTVAEAARSRRSRDIG